jgi:hypothetical protein
VGNIAYPPKPAETSFTGFAAILLDTGVIAREGRKFTLPGVFKLI